MAPPELPPASLASTCRGALRRAFLLWFVSFHASNQGSCSCRKPGRGKERKAGQRFLLRVSRPSWRRQCQIFESRQLGIRISHLIFRALQFGNPPPPWDLANSRRRRVFRAGGLLVRSCRETGLDPSGEAGLLRGFYSPGFPRQGVGRPPNV